MGRQVWSAPRSPRPVRPSCARHESNRSGHCSSPKESSLNSTCFPLFPHIHRYLVEFQENVRKELRLSPCRTDRRVCLETSLVETVGFHRSLCLLQPPARREWGQTSRRRPERKKSLEWPVAIKNKHSPSGFPRKYNNTTMVYGVTSMGVTV